MGLFNFESSRTKEGLAELGDMMVWLKYLYISPENSVVIQDYTVKMDSDFNLLYVMKSKQLDGTYKEDYDHSICANSLSYRELLEITESLRKDKKTWDSMKLVVSAASVTAITRKQNS